MIRFNEIVPGPKDVENILQDINAIINGNAERSKILKRQVHFYTLFTTLYYLTMDGKLRADQQMSNYRNLIDNSKLLNKLYPTILNKIYHSKLLSKEGPHDKGNCFDRHEMFKSVFTYKKP